MDEDQDEHENHPRGEHKPQLGDRLTADDDLAGFRQTGLAPPGRVLAVSAQQVVFPLAAQPVGALNNIVGSVAVVVDDAVQGYAVAQPSLQDVVSMGLFLNVGHVGCFEHISPLYS